MSSLIDRSLNEIEQRRDNIIQGNINSIPSPFKRFDDDFIGVEQSTYYLITSGAKGAKSQFSSYVFIFDPILYAFTHKDKLKVTVFYFPLEETPERITQRFMSYLLYIKSNYTTRVSPRDLRSSKNDRPLDPAVLQSLKEASFREILDFFESCIIFKTDSNPTGIYKECKKYAEENGTVYKKDIEITDELGVKNTIKTFDYYVPNNLKEYKIIFIDHISLIDTEKGLSLKQSMDKLSEYLSKYLRNRYGFTPVVIQQQNTDSESNDNFKTGKIRPSIQGLADSKYTGRDANIILGIFSPFIFEIKEFLKYDITKFRDNIRFIEVLRTRDGAMGGICPLYFDGAVSYFKELPLPTDTGAINRVYSKLEELRNEKKVIPTVLFHIVNIFKNKK